VLGPVSCASSKRPVSARRPPRRRPTEGRIAVQYPVVPQENTPGRGGGAPPTTVRGERLALCHVISGAAIAISTGAPRGSEAAGDRTEISAFSTLPRTLSKYLADLQTSSPGLSEAGSRGAVVPPDAEGISSPPSVGWVRPATIDDGVGVNSRLRRRRSCLRAGGLRGPAWCAPHVGCTSVATRRLVRRSVHRCSGQAAGAAELGLMTVQHRVEWPESRRSHVRDHLRSLLGALAAPWTATSVASQLGWSHLTARRWSVGARSRRLATRLQSQGPRSSSLTAPARRTKLAWPLPRDLERHGRPDGDTGAHALLNAGGFSDTPRLFGALLDGYLARGAS